MAPSEDGLRALLTGSAHLSPGPAGGLWIQRIEPDLRFQVPDPFFQWVQLTPAGVHLRFQATSQVNLTLMPYTPPGESWTGTVRTTTPEAKEITAYSHTTGGVVHLEPGPGQGRFEPGTPLTISVPPSSAVTEILLDQHWPVEIMELSGQAEPQPAQGRRWVHYGSSISHGYEAKRPDLRWVEQLAEARNLDLVDYSLSGNAQLDNAVARSISRNEADFITLAVGINLANADSMRQRTFVPALHAFIDTIRDAHPRTPITVISPIYCPIQENTPGPVVQGPDGRFHAASRAVDNDAGALTLVLIRELIDSAVSARHDDNLHVLNGLDFLGPEDAATLEDLLHPNQAGIDLIAQRALRVFDGLPRN